VFAGVWVAVAVRVAVAVEVGVGVILAVVVDATIPAKKRCAKTPVSAPS
jgi:hypothetical protein